MTDALTQMSKTAKAESRIAKAGASTEAHGPSSRQRFLNACRCHALDRSPVWLMRQAGRALPEYRGLKEKYSFVELVQTPDLAAEVTLQPIRRFGFDAAIIFSDILVIAEALGQKYNFGDNGGIKMDFLVRTAEDIERLEVEAVTERLQYVAKALALVRAELADETALIGFAGSPWTLANFMMEGAGVKEYAKVKELFFCESKLFAKLFEKLTAAVTTFLQMQIEAGVDAVQIFDSLGGSLSSSSFAAASGDWMKRIVAGLRGRVPVIVFSKGTNGNWDALVETGANVLGMDWTVRLADVREQLPEGVGVQGNLDPFLLTTKPELVATETKRILGDMRGKRGHIFNLGHGVPPNAKLDCIEALVAAVRNFK